MLQSSMLCVIFGNILDLDCSLGKNYKININVYTKYLPPVFDKINFVCVVKFIQKCITIGRYYKLFTLYYSYIFCVVFILAYFKDDII